MDAPSPMTTFRLKPALHAPARRLRHFRELPRQLLMDHISTPLPLFSPVSAGNLQNDCLQIAPPPAAPRVVGNQGFVTALPIASPEDATVRRCRPRSVAMAFWLSLCRQRAMTSMRISKGIALDT